MTTRKPKLNLLYTTEHDYPWLQLAVVTPSQDPSQQHARQWQAARAYGAPSRLPPAITPRKH